MLEQLDVATPCLKRVSLSGSVFHRVSTQVYLRHASGLDPDRLINLALI